MGPLRKTEAMIKVIGENDFKERYDLLTSGDLSGSPRVEDFELLLGELHEFLCEFGDEQWDYFVQFECPKVFVANLVFNTKSMFEDRVVSGLQNILRMHPAWAIRLEVYDHIKDGVMTAGDDVCEVLITNENAFGWGEIGI